VAIQWYEYTGTFGGSLWVWIGNTIIFKGVLEFTQNKNRKILYRTAKKAGLIILLPILISVILLKSYEEKGENINVLILQPNINPYTEKYNTTDSKISELLTTLTMENIDQNTDFIISPETVFADNNRLHNFENSIAKKTASTIVSEYPKAHFLSGISLIDVFRDSSRIRKQTNVYKDNIFYDDYNSAFFVRPDGSSELYHKSKLVVGVENFPYQSILKPLLGDVISLIGSSLFVIANFAASKEKEMTQLF